jgi:hypothetical protein
MSAWLVLLTVATALPSFAERGSFSGYAEIGFDSFSERYSVVEEDTVTNTIDFNTRVNIRYLSGSLFDDYFQIQAQARTGNNGYESFAQLKCARDSRKHRFGLEAGVTGMTFWENTSYSYPNDYARYNGTLFYTRRFGDFSSFGVSEYLERMDFERRNEFDYDYTRYTTAVNVDLMSPSLTSIHGGISAGIKSIPDSTEIAYTSYAGAFEFRRDFGLHQSVLISLLGERRVFAHKPARSPYWSVVSRVEATPLVRGWFGITVENTLESFRYDSYSSVYFDYIENKTAVLFMYYRSYGFEAGIGPLYAFLASDQSQDDRYDEVGGKAAVELLKSNRLWLSADFEFGQRTYDYYQEHPEDAIFSDYFFSRFSVFANWKLTGGIGLNGFLSHEPRNYRRAGDDTSTTLFSINIAWNP